jgi:hypothetical protein
VAWEWVAPTGTAVVGVVGIAGTYFAARRQAETTLITSRESNETALDVVRRQIDGSLQAERESRHHRRLEEVYIEMLIQVRVFVRFAQDVWTYLLSAGSEPPADPLTVEPRERAEALYLAYWSPKVEDRWGLFLECVLGMRDVLTLARQVREDGAPHDLAAIHQSARDLGERFSQMEERLVGQVWAELRGEDDGEFTIDEDVPAQHTPRLMNRHMRKRFAEHAKGTEGPWAPGGPMAPP